ncbi:enoyl-CoA hydratase/isomerase family protein [Mycolicibacterium pulveris]|uniref:Enoyl-CoA hydratase n=2 Tax=Mycolicibacterium pulveris TaxID=36813 RepID=A0A7I7URL1_MYCPV|nr:enoyl-CoA hydratase/isomerase family protein [Mycolicibacterium pulveris]BBY83431.1 enoyl-CoA hydratase [Mycolicibacterium pulveris]
MVLLRPEKMNSFDDALHVEMTDALRVVQLEADLRALLWRSTGKAFSVGGDFELMRLAHSSIPQRRRIVDDGLRLLSTFIELDIPIVVALHGDALGLGATLVLAADVVVTHPKVRIGDPHVQIGLVAGDGGCLVWPQSIGMMRARRHLLTGDPLHGDEAHRIGLVSDLVDDPDEVLPMARKLAERICGLPPLAVQGTKKSLNRVTRFRFDEVIELSFAHETTTLGSDDLIEAIEAFREKRTPKYRGC